MCGLAGIFDPTGKRPPERQELEAMIGAIRHRGPDGLGVYLDDGGSAGLAHARLAIVDLEGGAQPLGNEDDSIQVVFNGEIFNHPELRRTLEAEGHRFRTRSDTEVIVHAYEQYGLHFVDHLLGQFAIALWDRPKRRMVLARDRVGIRPLYYAEHDGRWLFASEAKGLFALPGLGRRLDARALASVFCLWVVLEPATPFEGVRQLPPGHLMTLDRDGVEVRRYWSWPVASTDDAPPFPREEAVDRVRALLSDAVRTQLRADVPVGAYLSGGLDSSLLAALVERQPTPLRTFSVRFEDPAFDEGAHQQDMVRRLGTDHSEVLCRTADVGAVFPRVVLHAETPILRTAPAPLFLLAERVRAEGYKVVLTGEGADEVFAGYDLFREAKVRRFWARRPQSRLRPRLLERLYPYLAATGSSPTAAPAFARAFFGRGIDRPDDLLFGHRPRFFTTRRLWRYFGPGVRDVLGDFDPETALADALPPEAGAWDPLGRDQYLEARTLLDGYLLSSQGDRMAMAHGVEGRVPYLDHRLIELACQMPADWRLPVLREKDLLKQVAADLVPASIRRRPKQPYRAPDAASFFVDGKELPYVAELLSPGRLAAAGYFDPVPVGGLLEKCRAGAAVGFVDNMAFVGILSTMIVDQIFVNGQTPC